MTMKYWLGQVDKVTTGDIMKALMGVDTRTLRERVEFFCLVAAEDGDGADRKIATFLPKPTEPGMKYTAEVSVAEIPRGKMIKPELVDTILDKEAILAMHEQQLDEAAQTAFFFTDDPNCDPNALVEEEYEVPVINLSKLDGLLLRALKAGRRDQIATSFAMMADSFKSLPMPSSEIEMACKLSDLGVALTDHMTQCDNETHEFRFTTPTLSMVVASLHSFAGIIYKRGVDREAAELADLGVAAEKQ